MGFKPRSLPRGKLSAHISVNQLILDGKQLLERFIAREVFIFDARLLARRQLSEQIANHHLVLFDWSLQVPNFLSVTEVLGIE
jgi:hypothetical protein